MSVNIQLPLSGPQAVAVVIAADTFGVEPWEMAVHVLWTTRIGHAVQPPLSASSSAADP